MKAAALLVLLCSPAAAGGSAWGELEAAARTDAQLWADGGDAQEDRYFDPAPRGIERDFPPPPERMGPTNSGPGAGIGWKIGFKGTLSPARWCWEKIPVAGYAVGGALYAALFVPAVLLGCLGALLGSMF